MRTERLLPLLLLPCLLSAERKLVWSDEFNGAGLPDSSKWTYEQGRVRNREAQFYTASRAENARLENGHLVIESRKERWQGADYTSASLTTEGKREFLYGRIEVRAKLPKGRGTWPAIWMLGANMPKVGWPACGEIDILEHVGFDPDVVHANVHTGAYNHAQGTGKGNNTRVAGVMDGFHVYALEWTPARLEFSVDGRVYFTYLNDGAGDRSWPFDKPQYLILNTAIGGAWGGRKGIDDTVFPARYEIDYVRVYEPEMVTVSETAGIPRVNEPVRVTADGRERVLYVTLGAGESKTMPLDQPLRVEPVNVTPTSEVGFLAENSLLRANLDMRLTASGPEDSGTLRALTYKPAGVTLLRTQNRMHWAPSFQREGARGYTSIATWSPVQEHARRMVDGAVFTHRKGSHTLYPEISIEAHYRFYPGVPYFEFESLLSIVKPVDIFWLRNQEMTMDQFFTHVAWPGHYHSFEEAKPILEQTKLAKDIPWVAFFNPAKGYGFGAVVLGYGASTETNADTQIADGAGNGKYWYRQIIARKTTPLKPGDRFREHTVFVLASSLEEFQLWERKLRQPVQVKVH